jgi:hypothetical protein
MPDDDKLSPATRRDVEICLSLALTSGRALARSQAAEGRGKSGRRAAGRASGGVGLRGYAQADPDGKRRRQSWREVSRPLEPFRVSRVFLIPA